MQALRGVLHFLRRTPLHPQWLLGNRERDADFVAGHARGDVLDVGCADRWIACRLQQSCNYVGLDFPGTGIALYGARPDVLADGASLPFANATFDTVLLLEVLEHVSRPGQALLEAARVLRPGGNLVLSMPFLYPIHDAPHDYQRYTAHGLARSLEAAGLRVTSLETSATAAETAGLLACLAIGGALVEAARVRSPSLLLLPVLVPLVPVINLLAWTASRLLPDWKAMTAGYRLVAEVK